MAGWSTPYPQDRPRIAAICAELDGVALAIELAAARLTTFGLDGLEAGLADQSGLLAGGPRLDHRHRSLRSALDWSFDLLDAKEQAVLRRASVFAAPFTSGAAANVTAAAPMMPGEVMGALARLADHNLLVVVAAPGGTHYRMLETIRQYGAERMAEAGEETMVRGRHLDWCRAIAARLKGERGTVEGFDEVADDLRAALGLGRRPTAPAGRGPRAGGASGGAHLCCGDAERGPASVRGGGHAGRRSRRRGPRASPWCGRGLGPGGRQRGGSALPGCGRGGPPGR
jgi:predicted ATPase